MNVLINLLSHMLRGFNRLRYRLLGVEVGKGVFISWKAKIDTTYRHSIVIEDGVYITFGAILLSHEHTVYRMKGKETDNGRGFIRVCKNAFIGANAIVLRNVTVGENAVVAAGAIVTKDVPSNSIVAGNPAKLVREFHNKI